MPEKHSAIEQNRETVSVPVELIESMKRWYHAKNHGTREEEDLQENLFRLDINRFLNGDQNA